LPFLFIQILSAEDKLLEKNILEFDVESLKVVNLGKQINSPQRDYSPFITYDFKEIYFTSDRNGSIMTREGHFSHDIWKAKIKYENDSLKFENVQNCTNLNTPYNEGSIFIAKDGVYMTYCNTPMGIGDCDLFKLIQLNGKTQVINLGEPINSRYFESGLSISSNRKTIYFASNRPNGSRYVMENIDIFRSQMDENNKWQTPERLPFNSGGMEANPFIISDNVTLIFSSKNLRPNYGGSDIYITRLDKKTSKWTIPQNMGSKINSKWDEITPFVNKNGTMMFFSSNRKDIKDACGDYDLYMVEFPIPLIEETER